MAASKTERLLNLIFLLLASRNFLTKVQIKSAIAEYRQAPSDSAFDRMFERDKEDLRELGIEVEMGTHDPLFSDNEGYRIPRDSAELGEIELTREEAAVIGLAGRVWKNAGLASGSAAALLKLRSAGVDVDTTIFRTAEPRLSTAEPAFEAVWEATTRRIEIGFDYSRDGESAARRHLQPWGIVSWRDRWYVTGFDIDRSAPRVFRLSRISSAVDFNGGPGSFEVPAGVEIKGVAADLFGPPVTESAVLRVRRDRGQVLRRNATEVRVGEDGFDVITVPYGASGELVPELASCGPDVVVISPQALRERVVAQLRSAAAGQLSPIQSNGAHCEPAQSKSRQSESGQPKAGIGE